MSVYSLVNALERAPDGQIVLELDGHLLARERLECRKDELRVVELARV